MRMLNSMAGDCAEHLKFVVEAKPLTAVLKVSVGVIAVCLVFFA